MAPQSRVRHSLDSFTAFLPAQCWPRLTAGTLRHHDALPLSDLQLGGILWVKMKDVDALVFAWDTTGPLYSRRRGIIVVVTLKVQQ